MKHLVPSLHEPVREVRRQRVVPKRRRSFRVFVVSGELVPAGKAQQRGREGGGGSRSASSSRHLFFPKLFLFVRKKSQAFLHFSTLSGKEEEELCLRKEGERDRERRESRKQNDNMSASSSSSLSTLRLYRNILRATKRFPSKNKDGLYKEIQLEFRENRALEDARDVEKKRAIAIDGLDRLRAFSGLDGKSNEWQVRLKGPSTEESR
jgi:hypothetical protein